MNSTPLTSLVLLLLLGVASALAKNVVIYEPYDVTTVYGWAGVGSQDGTGVQARFNYPQSGAFDQAGNLYVSDSLNETIRKITPAGVVTTFAGAAGQVGSADGQGSAARFNFPGEIAIDQAGNLFVADEGNNTIRKSRRMPSSPRSPDRRESLVMSLNPGILARRGFFRAAESITCVGQTLEFTSSRISFTSVSGAPSPRG